jgi:hypothetical protein
LGCGLAYSDSGSGVAAIQCIVVFGLMSLAQLQCLIAVGGRL